jgi:undecaprenyl-diphosphatase
MTIFEGILQGILQGITEFLPVSSSGHLSLFQHFFGLSGENSVLMTIVLHLGTLVAVFIAFWGTIKALIIEAFRMIGDIFTGKFKWKTMNLNRRMIIMIIISILPLFIFYIFKDFFAVLASDGDIIAEGVSFLYTSVLLFISIHYSANNTKLAGETTVGSALFIGFFQGVALLPGVSRSGSTIAAAMLTGMKRDEAVNYSFILGIPVILAGAVSEIGSAADSGVSVNIFPLAVGAVVAAVVGYLSIKLIKYLVVSDKFKIFAYYTGILGIVVIGLGIAERLQIIKI